MSLPVEKSEKRERNDRQRSKVGARTPRAEQEEKTQVTFYKCISVFQSMHTYQYRYVTLLGSESNVAVSVCVRVGPRGSATVGLPRGATGSFRHRHSPRTDVRATRGNRSPTVSLSHTLRSHKFFLFFARFPVSLQTIQ